MKERMNNFLNRPFPRFLWNDKGRTYYYWMIFFFVVLANVTKPFGFVNWLEYHRSMVLTNFIFLFFGMYPLVHRLLKFIHPRNFDTDTWTLKKEFQVLMFFFPAINGGSCLYADYAVPEFELTVDTFLDILLFNGTLSIMSMPTFGFFIDKKLIPSHPIQLIVLPRTIESIKPIELPQRIEPIELTQPIESTLPAEPKEKTKSTSLLTKEQALNIIQTLKELMETKQHYLSKKCTLHYLAEHSGIPRHRISEAINNFSDDNFSDFVNRYRVEHACRLLKDNSPKRKNIEVIGEECGFQNRMSFYNAFKKIYGISPSEYQERVNRE